MKAAIVGAGSIGALIDTPQSSVIASHAHAYKVLDNCELVAICEPNYSNQEEFVKRWGKVNIYTDLETLLKKEQIDVLSIATPTSLHADNLHIALADTSLTHILCEKPLVATKQELDSIKNKLLQSEKKILINLIRRYDPSFVQLASFLQEEKWGKVLDFHGVFNKSLLHNGIHMLAVLEHFFEKVTNIELPLVTCKQATGTISPIENLSFSLFELDIICEDAKIAIKEGGSQITIYEKTPSSVYQNYFTLQKAQTLPNSLQHYAKNSLRFLMQEDSATCKTILNQQIELHETIFKATE